MESNSCLDENGNYQRPANEVVSQIDANECDNLGSNKGLDGTSDNNCSDLQSMICDMKQEVDIVASQKIMQIAANEVSKCKANDDPTLASMWSRILRFSQAITCILCNYDPYLPNLLMNGKYPQILMGSGDGSGYPKWVTPDTIPEEGSSNPVTSGGIYKAINDAILSVWRLWKEQPEFDYFAQTYDSSTDSHNLLAQSTATPPVNGDTALVASGTQGTSLLYTYTNGNWVFTRVLDNATDNLTNFATTHINKGFYEEKGIYYFEGTWQVLDADLTDLENKINDLQDLIKSAVISSSEEGYIMTTAPTYADAQNVVCDQNKATVVLITG